ncbi:hypothetical protein [Ferrimonas kyonanensis]|nr:hypothetical protein [Ferrimonas kyonanensis]
MPSPNNLLLPPQRIAPLLTVRQYGPVNRHRTVTGDTMIVARDSTAGRG